MTDGAHWFLLQASVTEYQGSLSKNKCTDTYIHYIHTQTGAHASRIFWVNITHTHSHTHTHTHTRVHKHTHAHTQEAPAELRTQLLRERFGSAQAAADAAMHYKAHIDAEAFKQLLVDRGIDGSSRCVCVCLCVCVC